MSLGIYLYFLMVRSTTPNGRAAELTFWHKSGFCQNFTMTSPETMYTKVAINELSFLLVTHTTYSDAQFDSYGIF
jgi:hypothetical protein